MNDIFFSQVPFADMGETVLLGVRVLVGVVMVYYGWGKIRDTRKTHHDFNMMGFHPGWFWGTLVLILEFFGGMLLVLGIIPGTIALLFGGQMLIGTVWKITKTDKPFPDWSYDLTLLALCLVILTFGPGILLIG